MNVKLVNEVANVLYEKFNIPMLDVASGDQALEHALEYIQEYDWKRKTKRKKK